MVSEFSHCGWLTTLRLSRPQIYKSDHPKLLMGKRAYGFIKLVCVAGHFDFDSTMSHCYNKPPLLD